MSKQLLAALVLGVLTLGSASAQRPVPPGTTTPDSDPPAAVNSRFGTDRFEAPDNPSSFRQNPYPDDRQNDRWGRDDDWADERADRRDGRYGYDRPNARGHYDDRRGDGRRGYGPFAGIPLFRLADELNLSRRQRWEWQRIDEAYARRGLTPFERRNPDAYRRVQFQKANDMLSVLTPRQRAYLRELERRYAFNGPGRRF